MKTKDFGLITTLAAKGQKFLGYSVDGRGRIWFEYPDTIEIRSIEENFFKNLISVQVQDFINAQTNMKTLVFKIREQELTYEHQYQSRMPANEIRS